MKTRHAMRRDAVEAEIIKAARQLGVCLWQLTTPVDWISLIAGKWFPVEIKDAAREGHKNEFTPAQVAFFAESLRNNGTVLVWRSVADVIADVQRIRGAK